MKGGFNAMFPVIEENTADREDSLGKAAVVDKQSLLLMNGKENPIFI